jgi:hypothetical protein
MKGKGRTLWSWHPPPILSPTKQTCIEMELEVGPKEENLVYLKGHCLLGFLTN